MKKIIRSLITGIIITIIMVLIMLKITIDFQWLLFIGGSLFFIGGFFNRKASINHMLNGILICITFFILFIFTVLFEIPELKYFIPIYFIACLLGINYDKRKKVAIGSMAGLVILMLFIAVMVIPKDLENSLTKEKKELLPEFQLKKISGEMINSKDLEGKVVVLDFFGTWCAPCIKELVELDKVYEEFKNKKDVEFYIINADLAGDTPEKFQKFIEKHNYKFNFAYDTDSEIYKLLNLQTTGLPSLLVIDKKGNIRMLHVGYNTAETNFFNHMVNTINEFR